MQDHMSALKQFPLNRKLNSFRWHKNPVLERGAPGEWDDNLIRDPMLFFDNTAPTAEKFKVYYCGNSSKREIFDIGLAFGPSPESLKKYGGNPVVRMTEEWEQGICNHTPYVIQMPGTRTFEMIYTAYTKNPSDYLCSLARVTSVDGKNWGDKKQVFKQVRVGARVYHPQKPILYYNAEESRYYLVFSGSLGFDYRHGLKNEGFTGLAVSDDGCKYVFEKVILPLDLAGSIYDSHGLVSLFGWHFLLVVHDSAWAYDGGGNEGYSERWLVSRDMRNWYGSPESVFDTYPDDGVLYSHLTPLLTEANMAYFLYDYGEPNRFGLVKLPLAGKPYTLILDKPMLKAGQSTEISNCYPAISLDGKDRLSLTVEAEYHKASSAPIVVHVYTSYDGKRWDTEEMKDETGTPVFGNLPMTSGKLVRATRDLTTNARYIKATVENTDRNKPVSNIKVIATI